MRNILILFIFISCVSLPTNMQYNKNKLSNEPTDVYERQRYSAMETQFNRDLDVYRDVEDLNIEDFIDEQLTPPKPPCNKYITHKQNTDSQYVWEDEEEIMEEEEAYNPTEEIEEMEFETVEEKIKHNFSKLGGDPTAINQALCFFNQHKDTKFQEKLNGTYQGETSIKNQDYMVVQDFTLPSSHKRFFLINMKTGDIDSMFSPHGMGKEPPMKANNKEHAVHFSNDIGTNLTPRGFMITGARGTSNLGWKWNMHLNGVQKGLNDNNRDRTIYFHPGVSSSNDPNEQFRLAYPGRASSTETDPQTWYVSERLQKEMPGEGFPQNMTYGCTAVASEYSEEVYEKTKGGALYYNYTPHEKELGNSYCGGDNLLIKD